MTLICVKPELMKNKAEMESALNRGDMYLHEPSIMGSWTKLARDLPVGFRDTVTRMPARDKFYSIERRADGSWKVK